MNWLNIFLTVILPLIERLIGQAKADPDCPDGVCEPIEAQLAEIKAEAEKPRASAFSFRDLFRCMDKDRLFNAVGEIFAVFLDGMRGCPPAE